MCPVLLTSLVLGKGTENSQFPFEDLGTNKIKDKNREELVHSTKSYLPLKWPVQCTVLCSDEYTKWYCTYFVCFQL